MLRCRDVAELASDYVNRDLSLRERVRVAWHLAMCRYCRRYVAQIRRTVALLGGLRANRRADDTERARELFKKVRDPQA